MTRTHTVNFLPWRRLRLYRQLRRWGAGVLALWLVFGALALTCRLRWQTVASVDAVQATAERQLSQLLAQRQQALIIRAQEQAAKAQKAARRRATAAWSARLVMLAETLPAQAWLNELTYSDRTLQLSGTLTQFSALVPLERALNALPGFENARPGTLQRDEAGRWRVHYQLREEATHAAP